MTPEAIQQQITILNQQAKERSAHLQKVDPTMQAILAQIQAYENVLAPEPEEQ